MQHEVQFIDSENKHSLGCPKIHKSWKSYAPEAKSDAKHLKCWKKFKISKIKSCVFSFLQFLRFFISSFRGPKIPQNGPIWTFLVPNFMYFSCLIVWEGFWASRSKVRGWFLRIITRSLIYVVTLVHKSKSSYRSLRASFDFADFEFFSTF